MCVLLQCRNYELVLPPRYPRIAADVMSRRQVGFVVRLEGGRLSEDLADFLPDFKCVHISCATSLKSLCQDWFCCTVGGCLLLLQVCF